MFSSTVHQVVRSLGKDTLLPVPNLDASDNIYPLSIVMKETRRHLLFWTKHKCYTTEFKLSDILEDPTKEPVVKIDEKIFCKGFNRSTNLSLKGKFGVELAKELVDIDLQGARSVIVQSPLGDLQKDEVELQPFLDEINSRRINLDHPLVKPLINEKTLCVVTGVVKLVSDANLSSQVNFDETGKAGGTFSCISSTAVTVTASEEVDEKKSKTMKVPSATPVAYRVYELLVSTKDGSFQVQVDPDTKGGFTPVSLANLDQVDALAESFSAVECSGNPGNIFRSLLDLSAGQREQVQSSLRGIMELPQTVQPLSELLQEAEVFIDANIEKTTNLENLNKKIGTSNDDIQQFLTIAGFHINDGHVEYPRATSDIFEACQLLICLLEEFDDDELDAVARCIDDGETAQSLLSVLQKLQGKDILTLTLSPEEASVLSTDTAKNFIESVDVTFDDNMLALSPTNRLDLNAAYFVFYALYGQ
ncbi:gasdermin-E-like [Haliotis cracherodii]|uniref:gasdermin-E-like n=1 Tax=Haliotis cracherodii TaxID=6455 RepID=UPI0039ED068B